MKRTLLCSSLLVALFAVCGCRKTEVVAAPPPREVSQPTVIHEHDRPVIIDEHR